MLLGYKSSHWGLYNSSIDRKVRNSRAKFCEDKVILGEILPEFCILASSDASPPAEDEFTRGMRAVGKCSTVPIWLAFAGQVFLNIHHILREDVHRGFEDLACGARYAKGNTQRAIYFHKNLRMSDWPHSYDRVLECVLDMIDEWAVRDNIGEARKRITRNSL